MSFIPLLHMMVNRNFQYSRENVTTLKTMMSFQLLQWAQI